MLPYCVIKANRQELDIVGPFRSHFAKGA